MNDIISEYIKEAANKLVTTSKKVKRFETWRIKVDGEYIITKSGKTAWKQIGHAKSALRNHFELVESKCVRTCGKDYSKIRHVYKEEYQKFLNERVEFIKVD